MLFEATRNIPSMPHNFIDVITPISRADLDQSTPSWHADTTAEEEVVNFIYDIRNRKTFWVYPGPMSDRANGIEIVYAKVPEELDDEADNITIDDVYQPALLAYVLYRATSKDIAAENVGEGKARMYYEQFMTFLLGRDESDVEITLGKPQSEVKE